MSLYLASVLTPNGMDILRMASDLDPAVFTLDHFGSNNYTSFMSLELKLPCKK